MNKYEINIYEQIAKNIKKYRNLAGISQAELAERVGVSHEFIRRNESKKAGNPSLLILYGRFLLH